MPGALTLGLDLWAPLDVDTAVLYSVGIVMSGWLRSRWHLWFATVLFVLFVYGDLLIGAPPAAEDTPRWVYLANRSFLACTLLLIASIVHLWIRSVEAAERSGALLAQQNEKLRDSGAELERRVEERTRELEAMSEERQKALAALYQAQKMEAVGQLTGGVAHDFNNLLTVIGGNAAILRDTAPSERRARRLDAILQAADRGTRLTRQLLAFSRRQTLNPETLDLRRWTRETIEMLAGSLRENVQVTYTVPDDLWLVRVDPAQLELALLNIGINARDAMPEGGVLSVTARNVTFAPGADRPNDLVGDFVALTLSDTGSGIEPSVLERVFEPFFTTKEVGKGSGLGLSQVYGFAKQSGGAVTIRSELGRGTAVTLYLPRATGPVDRPAAPPPPAPVSLAGRVLYVEDNPAVAAVTEDMLVELGFEVRRVEDASAALAALDGGQQFDIVLTDVVMPGGMSGVDLAREIRRRVPTLPVLLTSGYSDEVENSRENGFMMLAKPYGGEALAAALARSLASQQQNER
jgi:signal transduction histidine kinase/CheY-like chemotaxis protein